MVFHIDLRCKKSRTVLVRFGSWLFSNSGRALALITADLRRSNVSRSKADRSIDSGDVHARAAAPRTPPPAVFIPKLDRACACCSHHTPLSPPTDHEILGKTEPTVQKFFRKKN
jgi:hypothetical protein